MDNKTNTTEVVANLKPGIAYAGATLAFCFTNFSYIFWAALLGFLGEGTGLAIGVIQVGVLGIYMAGAILLLKNGEAFEGNIFLIFAGFFGGAGGLSNIFGDLAAHWGMPFSGATAGVCWILSGILLLAVLPAVRKNPKTGFLFYIFGGIGLIVMGLTTLGILSAGWNTVAAWSFFIAGTCGLIVTISVMNGFMGVNNCPPLGKPFFK